jgi:putative MATE family efflux protein
LNDRANISKRPPLPAAAESSASKTLLKTSLDPEDPPQAEIALNEVDAIIGAEQSIRAGKLAGKSMWSAIWILSLPILVQQSLTACVGLVDKMLAGSLPEAIAVPAIDGIGIGAYVAWFIAIAMTGLGVGGQALIARAMGAGDHAQSQRALGQTISLSVGWGVLVGIAMYFSVEPLSKLSGLSPAATHYCAQYVHTLAYSMPLCGLLTVGAMCLHGAGETTKPALISIGINIVNVVFSVGLSGVDVRVGSWTFQNPVPIDPAEYGVVGIAAGTAVSYLFGAVATVWVLARGVKDLSLERASLAIDTAMSGRIMRIGVPNFMEGISMWAVNLFVLIFIGEIARKAAAEGAPAEGLQGAHIIAVQWESFSFLPGFAMGTAAGAIAGQYLGARNPRMAQRSIVACTYVACIIMGLMGVVFIFAGRPLTAVISTMPVHMEHVPNLLFYAGIVQVFFAITMVVRQGLRGVGDAMWTFGITSASSYLVRLPAAWLLGVHLGMGIEGVWIALCGELVIRCALFTARFLHGGWKKIEV